ncbi:hypothetical protein MIR68_007108 [Amoeboaphelidium protococcarum]|nr:hypothetical protein MIR68_007108 [Amoeboaphelidium protococcarum]
MSKSSAQQQKQQQPSAPHQNQYRDSQAPSWPHQGGSGNQDMFADFGSSLAGDGFTQQFFQRDSLYTGQQQSQQQQQHQQQQFHAQQYSTRDAERVSSRLVHELDTWTSTTNDDSDDPFSFTRRHFTQQDQQIPQQNQRSQSGQSHNNYDCQNRAQSPPPAYSAVHSDATLQQQSGQSS